MHLDELVGDPKEFLLFLNSSKVRRADKELYFNGVSCAQYQADSESPQQRWWAHVYSHGQALQSASIEHQ